MKIYSKYFRYNKLRFLLSIVVVGTFIFCGAHNRVSAQKQISLDDAISLAIENNYNVRISNSGVETSKLRNSWGYAGALPTLSVRATARLANNNGSDNFLVTPSLNLNWILFNGFSIRLTKERFEYLEKLSEGSATLVIENTVQAIILGYYYVLMEQDRLEVLKSNMELSKDRYDYIRSRVDFGTGSKYELLQAQTAYLSDNSRFLQQEMIVRNSKRQLTYLMAQKNLFDFQLSDSLIIVPQEYSLDELQNKMLESNQSVKNQYTNLELLRINGGLSRSSRYPSLTLNAQGDYNVVPSALNSKQFVDASNGNYSYYGSLVLNYTLFNGTKINREIQISEIEKLTGDIELEQMTHELSNNLANLYDLYNVRKELMNVGIENLQASKLNLDISKEKYKNGSLTSFEFRNIQQEYLDASNSYITSIYNLIETHTDLLRITGSLLNDYQ